ncbi:MAG: hypothetical protein IMF19_00570, partial [Proteobacteria bacterium]|nr:hypothetical protein [Pseudomonadota bacterium]
FLDNQALTTIRSEAKEGDFSHSFISSFVTDIHYVGGQSYIFPLYLYSVTKKSNLNPVVINFLIEIHDKTPSHENIFYYIYAVLHSPTYRKRYEAFLKIDFPRVPLTADRDLFKTLCGLGSELVSLHLMKSPELDNFITEFKGEGDNIVATIDKNSYKNCKLSINKTQYFEGIPEDVYNFHIGGYQVCQKWLKDRKGRQLTEEEIAHYQKIVVALNDTIKIMSEIDAVIEGHGGWPLG